MRLFIAINFTDKVRNNLYHLETELKKYSDRGNFSRKENLHVTLAFLGEVQEASIDRIVKAMDQSVAETFTLSIGEFGQFNNRNERLYWCGVKLNEPLVTLQSRLIMNLKQIGCEPDEKPFKPHITLVRRCKMKQDFNEKVFKETIPPMEMAVNYISLMKSEQRGGVLTYTELNRISMKSPIEDMER